MKEYFEKFKNMPILYPVAVMFAVCLVITAALAGTNALTEKKIEQINKENENAAMSRLIKADNYDAAKIKYKTKEYEYYKATSGSKIEGYIMTLKEKGYGGTVSVMVALESDGKVKAVEVLDVTSETPGLGQNAANSKFTSQFKGVNAKMTAVKYGTASAENEVNAVASATITSTAVTKAVNNAVKITGEIINESNAKTEESSDIENN